MRGGGKRKRGRMKEDLLFQSVERSGLEAGGKKEK